MGRSLVAAGRNADGKPPSTRRYKVMNRVAVALALLRCRDVPSSATCCTATAVQARPSSVLREEASPSVAATTRTGSKNKAYARGRCREAQAVSTVSVLFCRAMITDACRAVQCRRHGAVLWATATGTTSLTRINLG